MNIHANKKCKYCQHEIDWKATVCFQCGKYQNIFTENVRRFTANTISIILLILTATQLFLAMQEKSRASEAANKANEALNKIERIEDNIKTKDAILKTLIKANFENLYITKGTTIGLDFKNEKESGMKVSKNDSIILEIIEPDIKIRKAWLDSLKQFVY